MIMYGEHPGDAAFDTDDEGWLDNNYQMFEDEQQHSKVAAAGDSSAVDKVRGPRGDMAHVEQKATKASEGGMVKEDELLMLEDEEEIFADQTLAYTSLSTTSMVKFNDFYDPAQTPARNERGLQPGLAAATGKGGMYGMFREEVGSTALRRRRRKRRRRRCG